MALFFLAACATPEQPPTVTQPVITIDTAVPTPTTAATSSPAPEPTPVSADTAVPLPTNSPTPIPSLTPSSTLIPSLTPSATATSPPTATATPAPPTHTPTHAIPHLPIGNLSSVMGQEVSVSGTVVAVASFSHGFRFTLDDGSGQVILLMWHDVYDESWAAPDLNLGATVRVTGEIGEFEGELQIVPDFGGDVRVTAVAATTAPAANIGDLGSYMGQRVTITGQISRIEGTNSGAKLFVTDDAGEILIFVWHNVLDRVQNNTALGTPGTRVRVTGVVQEFRSNREIVPTLPYDIVVLP